MKIKFVNIDGQYSWEEDYNGSFEDICDEYWYCKIQKDGETVEITLPSTEDEIL